MNTKNKFITSSHSNYEKYNGPLTTSQIRQIKKMLPKKEYTSLKSSLLYEIELLKIKNRKI